MIKKIMILIFIFVVISMSFYGCTKASEPKIDLVVPDIDHWYEIARSNYLPNYDCNLVYSEENDLYYEFCKICENYNESGFKIYKSELKRIKELEGGQE